MSNVPLASIKKFGDVHIYLRWEKGSYESQFHRGYYDLTNISMVVDGLTGGLVGD